MQVGFNCLLFHKGVTFLVLPVTCKDFNSLLLMCISLMHMLTVKKPLSCINTLWLGVYIRYTPWNMLDVPQQNALKYSFSRIE